MGTETTGAATNAGGIGRVVDGGGGTEVVVVPAGVEAAVGATAGTGPRLVVGVAEGTDVVGDGAVPGALVVPVGSVVLVGAVVPVGSVVRGVRVDGVVVGPAARGWTAVVETTEAVIGVVAVGAVVV